MCFGFVVGLFYSSYTRQIYNYTLTWPDRGFVVADPQQIEPTEMSLSLAECSTRTSIAEQVGTERCGTSNGVHGVDGSFTRTVCGSDRVLC